ncbi:MAG TPA: thiamine pyrophosphate-binding protein [Solirubrobacteraceae bacterium]|jgi:benzoylformate decarboxylase|nr:thiamine pyrophosphate-binding protein [Solirubrobacteraceae bacterium]
MISALPTVRDQTFEVMRRHGMTRIFGNPGSTEIPFLTDLPGDFEFVLALHEGSVVGIASGYALATGRPAFVNLHTAPGLGHAGNAIGAARDSRAPVVVVVGQQDRAQLAMAPFLAGRDLDRLAGSYPVWSTTPARPQDLPGSIARAWHEARTARGPALVIAPMGDWQQEADPHAVGAPERLVLPAVADPAAAAELADLIAASRAPALVVGAGCDSEAGWAGTVALAERLGAPVWQEAFGDRAGFPQDHPLWAGHLPWQRSRMRATLAPHDLVIVLGAGALRLYMYEPGAYVEESTRIAVLSADAEQLHRSAAALALLGPPGPLAEATAALLDQRPFDPAAPPLHAAPAVPPPPPEGKPLQPGHVLAAVAERVPPEAIVMEECPSSRPELLERISARRPMGFISNANGGLGFGISGSIGLRMGSPQRPVVAILGDGSTMYAIHALWSAARYGVGLLVIVLANGSYAVMDALARDAGGEGAWPGFPGVSIATLAEGFGCPSRRIATHAELIGALDEIIPSLASRSEPLVLEVAVSA